MLLSKIFIPVKYNKQVMNLDIESASELVQKGMKFDSIKEYFEQLKNIAKSKGKSIPEFLGILFHII